MKRTILIITAILCALFIPMRKANMASKVGYSRFETPMPPISGRKNEKKAYSRLNSPEFSFGYWLGKGKSYLSRKEYEQAIIAFRKARKLRPASEETRHLLAYSYEKRGLEGLPGDQSDWEALAEREYKASIMLADYLPSRYNLALLQIRNERLSEARKELEHILTVSPTSKFGKLADSLLASVMDQDYLPEHLSVNY